MLDFIGENSIHECGRFVLRGAFPGVPQLREQVHLAGLDGSVLNCQPARQRVDRASHAPVVVDDREFAGKATVTDQLALDQPGVTRFVPALARVLESQSPWCLGEIDE
jgi:hypothetical protein